MRWRVQFTARKRDPVTRAKNRWHHGPYTSRGAAEEHAARMRTHPNTRGRVRVETVPEHHQARKRHLAERRRGVRVSSVESGTPDHAARTRAGMAAAAAAGASLGRPRAKLNVERAREIFAARARAMGREEAWRFTAKLMHVSVSTLKRALAKGGGR